MDLAPHIRRHLGKFVATISGVALLLAIVLVMNGIYQGNIADGIWLIENTATDLWWSSAGAAGRSTKARASRWTAPRAWPPPPAWRRLRRW
jgi:hypothetical protein